MRYIPKRQAYPEALYLPAIIKTALGAIGRVTTVRVDSIGSLDYIYIQQNLLSYNVAYGNFRV